MAKKPYKKPAFEELATTSSSYPPPAQSQIVEALKCLEESAERNEKCSERLRELIVKGA